MSNQETQNLNKTTEEAGVEQRRRFIKGAAAATPVILTLASPSVFGVECLSQQLSGNASHTPGSCVLGNDPTYWKGQTSYPSPYNFNGSSPSLFNDPNAFGTLKVSTDAKMSFILNKSTDPYYIWVTALLNSVLLTNYVLSQKQVIDLWNFDQQPYGYATKEIFLKATWGDGPLL
ncbi:MAG: hypothetical protein LUQ26_13305 [Methylococcaceae bacterium]|nr:hypothetical protein [Methylococcaceae bacterium]